MTEQELKSWLINKIYSCYPVITDDFPFSILWYYDKSYIRKQKLCKLNNQKFNPPSKVKGVCLFEQNTLNKSIHFDNDRIWRIILRNLDSDYFATKGLITKVLKKISVLYEYNPFVGVDHINSTKELRIMKEDDPYYVHTHVKF